MTKVLCASIECKHNKDGKCRAPYISISDGHINTVHQGYKHIHECRTYEQSEESKAVEKSLKKYFATPKGGAKDA